MSETEPGTGAHPYLMDGRRVTIGDLLEANLLIDQDKLTFHRPRKNQTHHAEVTAEGGGGIRLAASGKVFRSPSRAAGAAVGSGSFDGWSAWQTDSGAFLCRTSGSPVNPPQCHWIPRPGAPTYSLWFTKVTCTRSTAHAGVSMTHSNSLRSSTGAHSRPPSPTAGPLSNHCSSMPMTPRETASDPAKLSLRTAWPTSSPAHGPEPN